MARRYKKRTKSTKIKTYKDYLDMRSQYESKGYVLKPQMGETQFNQYYTRIRLAKKYGEIKSQPWQYIKSRETYLSSGQAKALSAASREMREKGLIGKIYSPSTIKKQATSQTVFYIGQYLTENKEVLFSGDYE